MPAAQVGASPPVTVQVEVEYLLGKVASSDCRFYRNGTWYEAPRAVEHLRYKYEALVARDLVKTTEDFIELGATRSSLSGRAYQIKCADHAAVPSNQWLREELARERQGRDHGAVIIRPRP